MELQHGRPQDVLQRLEKEQRTYDLLDRLGMDYDRVDHEAADTIEACKAVEGVLGAEICKNLFLCNRQQTQFYLLLIPGDKVFKTKYLSAELGVSRLSFAGEEHMERLMDLTPGSVTVLGLMNDKEQQVQLVIDEDVLRQDFIGCHPCINTSTLKLRTKDLLDTFLGAVQHTPIVVHLPDGEAQ